MSKASASSAAHIAIGMTAPVEWFDDDHDEGHPRCCEAIKCVEIALKAIPDWTEDDAKALARIVVDGLEALCR